VVVKHKDDINWVMQYVVLHNNCSEYAINMLRC